MRARVLLALVLISVVVLAGLAIFVALRDSRAVRAGIIAVDISSLSPGNAMPVAALLPGQPKWSRRVFVVRLRGDGVKAFLGRSTHLGCRLWFRGDPRFGQGLFNERGIAFQDPCGGSVFALNGDCVGGPCPRALDRYRVDIRDDTAEINLNHLLKGPSRGR
jgi:nitrite reductase/ring-hydroxylating ferredoxin subunit